MKAGFKRNCPELDLENQSCRRICNNLFKRPFGTECSACLAILYLTSVKEELRLAFFLAQPHVFLIDPKDNDSGVNISHLSSLEAERGELEA